MPRWSPGSLRSTFWAHVGSVILDFFELWTPWGAKVSSGGAKIATGPPKVTPRASKNDPGAPKVTPRASKNDPRASTNYPQNSKKGCPTTPASAKRPTYGPFGIPRGRPDQLITPSSLQDASNEKGPAECAKRLNKATELSNSIKQLIK